LNAADVKMIKQLREKVSILSEEDEHITMAISNLKLVLTPEAYLKVEELESKLHDILIQEIDRLLIETENLQFAGYDIQE
jgi:hypothetical protein